MPMHVHYSGHWHLLHYFPQLVLYENNLGHVLAVVKVPTTVEVQTPQIAPIVPDTHPVHVYHREHKKLELIQQKRHFLSRLE